MSERTELLIGALTVIAEECSQHTGVDGGYPCTTCPLGVKTEKMAGCLLLGAPYEWPIAQLKKAFAADEITHPSGPATQKKLAKSVTVKKSLKRNGRPVVKRK